MQPHFIEFSDGGAYPDTRDELVSGAAHRPNSPHRVLTLILKIPRRRAFFYFNAAVGIAFISDSNNINLFPESKRMWGYSKFTMSRGTVAVIGAGAWSSPAGKKTRARTDIRAKQDREVFRP